MIYLVRDNCPQRDNTLIYLFHYTLDFEGAVGDALGLCPRDDTYWGIEMHVLVLAPNNLPSFIYEWAGTISSGFGSEGHMVGPVYRNGCRGTGLLGHYPCEGHYPEPDKSTSSLIHTITL